MDVLLATERADTIALNGHGYQRSRRQGGFAYGRSGGHHDRWHSHEGQDRQHPRPTDSQVSLEGYICIVAGFQGQTVQGSITTLVRGGSDLTAIAIAAALKANNCEIYTDVDGIYTCDPRIVPNPVRSMSSPMTNSWKWPCSGSKVMQSRSVEFAKKFKVPFEVRSSFNTQRNHRERRNSGRKTSSFEAFP